MAKVDEASRWCNVAPCAFSSGVSESPWEEFMGMAQRSEHYFTIELEFQGSGLRETSSGEESLSLCGKTRKNRCRCPTQAFKESRTTERRTVPLNGILSGNKPKNSPPVVLHRRKVFTYNSERNFRSFASEISSNWLVGTASRKLEPCFVANDGPI